MPQKNTTEMTDKEFFDNFISGQSDSFTMEIAKAQDTIDKMNKKIERLTAEQNNRKEF